MGLISPALRYCSTALTSLVDVHKLINLAPLDVSLCAIISNSGKLLTFIFDSRARWFAIICMSFTCSPQTGGNNQKKFIKLANHQHCRCLSSMGQYECQRRYIFHLIVILCDQSLDPVNYSASEYQIPANKRMKYEKNCVVIN